MPDREQIPEGTVSLFESVPDDTAIQATVSLLGGDSPSFEPQSSEPPEGTVPLFEEKTTSVEDLRHKIRRIDVINEEFQHPKLVEVTQNVERFIESSVVDTAPDGTVSLVGGGGSVQFSEDALNYFRDNYEIIQYHDQLIDDYNSLVESLSKEDLSRLPELNTSGSKILDTIISGSYSALARSVLPDGVYRFPLTDGILKVLDAPSKYVFAGITRSTATV
jgi:hypothetical protein